MRSANDGLQGNYSNDNNNQERLLRDTNDERGSVA